MQNYFDDIHNDDEDDDDSNTEAIRRKEWKNGRMPSNNEK
jgi:hypothetical protein